MASDYQVKINIFEGPMDLLLHLIQKTDLDIYDIPICEITSEYLKYLDLLKELNLNVAGEFLLMASTLMQIKSHMLLPAEEGIGDLEGPDPRTELIQKLIEYQKFKAVSQMLKEKFDQQKDVFYRGAPIFDKDDQILEVSLETLLDAFQSVLETAETGVREYLVEEIPVEVRIREVLDILEARSFVTFQELFPKNATRKMLVVSFLALLELIRLRQVRVTQTENFSEIHIERISYEEPVISGPTP